MSASPSQSIQSLSASGPSKQSHGRGKSEMDSQLDAVDSIRLDAVDSIGLDAVDSIRLDALE